MASPLLDDFKASLVSNISHESPNIAIEPASVFLCVLLGVAVNDVVESSTVAPPMFEK